MLRILAVVVALLTAGCTSPAAPDVAPTPEGFTVAAERPPSEPVNATSTSIGPPADPAPAANDTAPAESPPPSANETDADPPASSPPPSIETNESNVTREATEHAPNAATNASVPRPTGKLLLNATFDYSAGSALVPLQAVRTFAVEEGFERVVLDLRFVAKGSSQPTDRARTVGLVPPDAFVAPARANANANTTANLSAAAEPGEWRLEFDGQGPVEALIEVRVFTKAEWSMSQQS